jgi:hypothetical protein
MPDMNRISTTLSIQDITAINNAIETITTKLPFLIGLSDADRREKPKMGDKSEAFHNKVQGYMQTNPEFTPGFIEQAEVDKDQTLREQMLQFFPSLKTLFRSVDDTFMEVNSELWMADLAYYQNVRQAANRGINNAQAIYDDLKPRFPGGGSKPPKTP